MLLDEVKNELNITFNDADTDKKIESILHRSEAILNKYASETLDFENNLCVKQLLFDCCRYIYNDAREDFEKNFSSDLIILRAEHSDKENKNESE